jgi:predicted permease
VIAQVSIACVLLVTAALLVQSVSNQLRADFGFSVRQGLLASVEIPPNTTPAAGREFYRAAAERIAAIPGVGSVAWVRTLPLSGGSRRGFTPEGYVRRDGEDLELNYNIVTPSYFETLGIPLIAGRTFTEADMGAKVAIVNELLAKRFFNGNAVGRRITDSAGTSMQIVGVVRSGKFRTVMEDAPPILYYPLEQLYSPRMSMAIRAAVPPERLADAVRREVRAASGDVPVFRIVTLQTHLEEALSAERLSAALVTACGILSALLAIVGLYGAVSYLVARRTREIGVRVALGAQPRHVIALIVRHGFTLAVAGIGLGLVCAAALATLLRSMLYDVSPASPLTHAGVGLGLAVVGALAAYVPAHRAVRMDPARALASD